MPHGLLAKTYTIGRCEMDLLDMEGTWWIWSNAKEAYL